MELYQLLCLIGIPTLSTLIITFVFNYLTNSGKKAKENRSRERKEDLKVLFDEFITPMDKKVDNISLDLKKVSVGTLASLRNDLLECYYSCKRKGYRNSDDTKNFGRMFNAYIDLGGNDIIEHDVAPSFHNLRLVTYDEEIRIQHEKLTKQEIFEHSLEEVIEKAARCSYYNKAKIKASKKEQVEETQESETI